MGLGLKEEPFMAADIFLDDDHVKIAGNLVVDGSLTVSLSPEVSLQLTTELFRLSHKLFSQLVLGPDGLLILGALSFVQNGSTYLTVQVDPAAGPTDIKPGTLLLEPGGATFDADTISLHSRGGGAAVVVNSDGTRLRGANTKADVFLQSSASSVNVADRPFPACLVSRGEVGRSRQSRRDRLGRTRSYTTTLSSFARVMGSTDTMVKDRPVLD
jgi:hypothetical protein